MKVQEAIRKLCDRVERLEKRVRELEDNEASRLMSDYEQRMYEREQGERE